MIKAVLNSTLKIKRRTANNNYLKKFKLLAEKKNAENKYNKYGFNRFNWKRSYKKNEDKFK